MASSLRDRAAKFLSTSAPHHRAREWYKLIEEFMNTPTKVVLHCPRCKEQHVDQPEPAKGWTNPSHKSHTCWHCKAIWRAGDSPTEGVAYPQTRGKDDTIALTEKGLQTISK